MTEAIIEWPAEGYRRTPYGVFHDPRIHAREQEKLFRGPVWNFLALAAELTEPGDFKSTFVGITPVVVTHGHDGTYHAFVNRCAHRGSLVCLDPSGKKRDGFTCIYHAWGYDLAGNLKNVAFRRGVRGEGGMPDDFELADHGLEKLRVESFAGLVFGTFSEATEPLADYIGPVIGAAIKRTMRAPVEVLGYDSQILNANWKAYGENSRDSYHANILHTFFGTFGISRHSQKAGMIQDDKGRHFYTYTQPGTEVESKDYEETAATLRSVNSDFSLADPSLIAWKDEYGDGNSTFITSLFPVFMIQQVQHSLAVRQLLPKSPNSERVDFHLFRFRRRYAGAASAASAASQSHRLGRPRLDGGRHRRRTGGPRHHRQRARLLLHGNGRQGFEKRRQHQALGKAAAEFLEQLSQRHGAVTVSIRARVPEATRRVVEDLIYDAAHLIDDNRLEALPEFFLEDATYRVASRFNVDRGLPLAPINCSSRGMLVDRIESLRKANIYAKHHYRHLVSGITITAAEGDTTTVRSNYMVIRTIESGASTLFSCGEYRDRIVLRDGVAFFQERLVVFNSKSIETLLVIPL